MSAFPLRAAGMLFITSLAGIALGRPATIEVRCHWSSLEKGSDSLEVAIQAADMDRPPIHWSLARVPLRYEPIENVGGFPIVPGDIFTPAGGYGAFTVKADDAALRFSAPRDGLLLRISVQPDGYHIIAKLHSNSTTRVLLDRDFNATSGKSLVFDIEKRSVLAAAAAAVLQAENIPLAVSVLLFSALVAVLKEKLRAGWQWLLDGVGNLGVRHFRERAFARDYLRTLENDHKYLRLIGLNTSGYSRPLLERVFISLRIAQKNHPAAPGATSSPTVGLGAAVSRFPKLVILGAPGAGKTTTLSYTLLQFAAGLGKKTFGIREPLLPIFIPLRRVSAKNVSLLDDLITPENQILGDELLDACPKGFFERRMRAGDCIVLLDGLDEVSSQSHQRTVAQKINNLVSAYPDNRFIATCRIAGWQELLPGFQVLQTQDLNRDEIHSFIEGWHAAMITERDRSEVRMLEPDDARFEQAWRRRKDVVATAIDVQSRKLINAIETNQRIQAVATNPMLLSLICLVHLNRQILPRGRSLLYRECVELLIDAWDRSRDLLSSEELSYTQKETALREIAYELHVSGRGELPRTEIDEVAATVARNLGATISGHAFVDTLERRSGLLIERSIDVLGFSHLTLQEYLVARHIQQNPEFLGVLRSKFDDQSWREVILLYCGLIDDATAIVGEVLAEAEPNRLLLAALCIGESQRCDSRVVQRVSNQLLAWRVAEPIPDLPKAWAAVASDYGESALTPGQRLAESLIALVTGRHPYCTLAIQALGLARVTKALPAIVRAASFPQLLETSEISFAAISSAAIPAAASFGNLALPEIARVVDAIGGFESSPLIVILRSINTSQAAHLLIEFLGNLDLESFSYGASIALAMMMSNPRILEDLLSLSGDEVGEIVWRHPTRQRDGWKYAHPAGAGFLKVEARISHELGTILEGEHRTLYFENNQDLRAISLRTIFPALLCSVRSESTFEFKPDLAIALGFEIDDGSAPLLRQVTTAVRRNDVDLWTTLERPRAADVSATSRRNRIANLLGISSLIVFATLHFSNAAFLSYVIITANHPQPWLYPLIVSSVAFYLVITIIVLWRRRRHPAFLDIASNIFCPLPSVLRQLPALSPDWPWAGFAAFVAAYLALSCVGVEILDDVLQGRIQTDENVTFFTLGAVFIGALATYYHEVILKTDVLRELLMLHPEGRELLRNV